MHGPIQFATLSLLERKVDATIRAKLVAAQDVFRQAPPVGARWFGGERGAGWSRGARAGVPVVVIIWALRLCWLPRELHSAPRLARGNR
jgi:hypothetical protein